MSPGDAGGGSDIGNIGIKEIGRFTRQVRDAVDGISSGKASKHDLYSELSIELDGISELTRIDPNRFLKVVRDSKPGYDGIVKDYRKKVFTMTNYSLTNDVVDSIVEVMLSLNLLRELVFEAGGYENALEHACDKYGIAAEAIEVRADEEGLTVVRLQKKHEIEEASRLITSFYGPKVAEELFSIFMIARVGSLLAVKDSFGKILGVVQLLYDRWGDSYVHAYCVLKSYRGSGVASMLLEAVEKHSTGGHVWATRSLDMAYNIRSFLQLGYSGRAYVPDYWGKGVPRIVFEKNVGGKAQPVDEMSRNVPHITELDTQLPMFSTGIRNSGLIEEAMNVNGYEMVDLFAMKEEGGEPDTVLLRKAEDESVFLSRDYGLKLSPFSDGKYKPVVIRNYEGIYEAIALEERVNADPKEDYGTFKMLTYVGALVGLRDENEALVSFAGLVWDGEGGMLCHSLTSVPGSGLNEVLVEYIGELAHGLGLKSLSLFASLEDMGTLKALVNDEGFIGTQEFLNPYDNGQNYLLLRRDFAGQTARGKPDPGKATVLRSAADLKQDGGDVLVSSRNYGLTVTVLKEGYTIRAVVDSRPTAASEGSQHAWLLSK